MGKLIDWALDKIDHLPSVPGPFLVAFLIIFALIGPTILRALKAKPEAPQEVVPKVLLDAGGVYTILVDLQIQMGRVQGKLDMIETMVRRRQKRQRKTPKPD